MARCFGLLTIVLLVACEDGTVLSRSAGGAGGSGGEPGSGGQGGGSTRRCPPDVPAEPTCSDFGLLCTYGDEPDPGCRVKAYCLEGMWLVEVPSCLPVTSCAPLMSGEICMLEGELCHHPDGTLCYCASCVVGPCMPSPPVWNCVTPEPGCAAIAPNAGTGCSTEGQTCSYGVPCTGHGALALCDNGEWRWEEVVCAE